MIDYLIQYIDDLVDFINRFGCLPEDSFGEDWEAIMDGLQQDLDEERKELLRDLKGA